MQAYHVLGEAPLYTNTFVLISEGGHAVIIDPAASVSAYEKILQENGAELTTIFCTHGHYDHVGSAVELKKKWNATLYCEASDTKGNRIFPLKGADRGYDEGETIRVDEMTFTVWHTAGHTKGSVCILIENFFFTGDTLFQGSMGRTDLPDGDEVAMYSSLRKLTTLPIPQTAQVLSGHGDFSEYGHEMKNNWYIRDALRRGIE